MSESDSKKIVDFTQGDKTIKTGNQKFCSSVLLVVVGGDGGVGGGGLEKVKKLNLRSN